MSEIKDLKKLSTFSANLVKDLTPINETMSLGRVRLFYRGLNRNQSFITDEFAEKLLKTLPYTPVCGIYNEEEQDFKGHLREKDEDSFAYGVVPQDMNLQWERHLDGDGVERVYACCDVVLWTEKYQHAKEIFGKGQSMELFVKSIEGDWVTAPNGTEMFVYSNGCFIGLQALGDNVTPCFEGAEFFSLDKKEEKDLINELKNYNLLPKNDIISEKEEFQMDEKELKVVDVVPDNSDVVKDPLMTMNDEPIKEEIPEIGASSVAATASLNEEVPAAESLEESAPVDMSAEEGKVEEGEVEPAPVNAACDEPKEEKEKEPEFAPTEAACEEKKDAPAEGECDKEHDDEDDKDDHDDHDDYAARYETLKADYEALKTEVLELREVFLSKYSDMLDRETYEELSNKVKQGDFSLVAMKAEIGTKMVEDKEFANYLSQNSNYILNLESGSTEKLSGAARIIKKHKNGGTK